MMIETSIFNLRKVFIVLGTACNFNCVYCVQHENKPRCKKVVTDDVLEWLDHLAYRLPKKFKPIIHFYGGEPLLYKSEIERIINRFGDDFNYEIVSNGAYLEEEDVEFYNKNDVYFILSHDGPNTEKTRQVDMLKDENFVKLFMKLKHRAIDTVYTALSQDLYAVGDYIHKFVPDTLLWHEDLVTSEYMPNELTSFDVPALLKMYKRMGDELDHFWLQEAPSNEQCKTFQRWIKRACGSIKTPTFGSFPSCGAGKQNLSIDTQGNVYLCKNFNVKIGTVKNSYEELNAAAKEKIKELRDSHLEAKGCFTCSAFYFCRGGCPFEKPSAAQRAKCDMVRTKWASVVSFIDNRMEIVTE